MGVPNAKLDVPSLWFLAPLGNSSVGEFFH